MVEEGGLDERGQKSSTVFDVPVFQTGSPTLELMEHRVDQYSELQALSFSKF